MTENETRAADRLLEASISRRRFLQAVGALSVSGVIFAACGDDESGGGGGGGGGGGKAIGVNLPFTENDPWLPLMAGAEQEAKARGYRLLKTASNLEVETQLNELNTWIAQGVVAMTIFPLDPTALRPIVERAKEKGIKIVAYASTVPRAEGSNLFDDKQGGQALAEAAAEYARANFDGKPKVALITQDDAEVARMRKEAMVAHLKKLLPDTEIVAEAEGRTPPQGLRLARPILEANPDVNMFLAHNDPPLAGVGQALAAAGRKPEETWLGGMDGAKIFLDKLASGDLVGGSAALDLIKIGRDTVAVAANLVEGKQPTKTVQAYEVPTNENKELLKKYIDQYAV
jgi:ribose transport system substrate-binding protein